MYSFINWKYWSTGEQDFFVDTLLSTTLPSFDTTFWKPAADYTHTRNLKTQRAVHAHLNLWDTTTTQPI